jgi:hypothetical protein
MLDNSFVQTSSTPITRRDDADGNTYQTARWTTAAVHEVLKNFPTPDEARPLLGRAPAASHGPVHPLLGAVL